MDEADAEKASQDKATTLSDREPPDIRLES
jgi:hypothetical protein